MEWESALLLILSTLGVVLIGYVVLTTLFRVLSRPTLLLPWMRKQKVTQLQMQGNELLSMRLSSEDRHAVERAMNTLRIQHTSSMTGPWSKSDPITDAENDIQSVWNRMKAEDRS